MFEYLCQSTQRRISCNTFFWRSIRTFWSSIWSSTVKIPFIFIHLCGFSIVDVPGLPGRGKCSQAPAAALRVTAFCRVEYLHRNNMDKWYGSERLALFAASLTKKCVVRNCAFGKWQCFHNETSVTRSI